MSTAQDAHCRIGKIRFKRTNRYRSPSAFNVMTNALREELARRSLLKSVRG